MDLDAVAAAIVHAAAEEVLPRFRRLEADDIEEKNPGDLVTVADRACETLLTELLRDIDDIPVVGEEAVAADPSILRAFDGLGATWLVDPIDGTTNFASGSTDYAVMVARVEGGVTQASWIWQPSNQSMASAVRGQGAAIDGNAVTMGATGGIEACRGVLKSTYIAEPQRSTIEQNATATGGLLPARGCAGVEYPDVVTGEVDFLFYWRTLPWDHAPGVLFAEEAGGACLRPDGSSYRPGDDTLGLLVTNQTIAADLLAVLMPA